MLTHKHRPALLLLAAAAAFIFLLFCPTDATAQCALCRAALEKGGEQTARAMNSGIIVLLLPPVAIFCGVFAIAFKSAKGDKDEFDDQDGF
ncbi:MAG: hypothetical protein WCD76_13140 [Pyrinomonadaceae bacterium]